MRISDWSSDVCSSDLTAARFRLAAVDDHRQRVDILAVHKDRHLHQVVLAVADLVIIEAGVSPADRLQPVVEVEHHFRSEEHTSELQSLMRTSYAVFCLKKNRRAHVYTPATYTH